LKSFLSKNTLWGFLIFLPVALYFYFLSEYAINIPKWDDHALKAFIVEFENANGLIPKLQTFFKQHNEHRIAFDRFFTLIVFWIHGSIEYRWLMWIGNFTLLGVLFIFYKIFQKQKLSLAFFVPIPFILFQLQLWENTFWGMAAMQNFGIIFFITALIYLVGSEKRSNFYLALLVAFLATYTSGNGVTIFPVCIALLIFQRRFKDVFVFGLISAILVFLYFYQYKFPENNPTLDGIGIKKIGIGFLMFLGSVFDLIPNASQNQKMIILGGALLLLTGSIIAIYLIFNSNLFKKQRNLNHTELFTLGSLMFLIGTAIVVTFTRISYGEVGLLTSRYKIYSILLLITIYIAFISKINIHNNKWLPLTLIFMAMSFNLVANYTNYKEIINFRNQLISFAVNWKLEENTFTPKPKINLYESPNLGFENNFQEIKLPVKNAPIWKESTLRTIKSDGILIQNENFPVPTRKEDNISLIVQSNKRTYSMPSQLINYPLKAFVRTGKYWQNGFVCVLNNNEFENGIYQLGIFIKNGSKVQRYYLNDSLLVNNPNSKPLKTNW
jgi:hypothetical protein